MFWRRPLILGNTTAAYTQTYRPSWSSCSIFRKTFPQFHSSPSVATTAKTRLIRKRGVSLLVWTNQKELTPLCHFVSSFRRVLPLNPSPYCLSWKTDSKGCTTRSLCSQLLHWIEKKCQNVKMCSSSLRYSFFYKPARTKFEKSSLENWIEVQKVLDQKGPRKEFKKNQLFFFLLVLLFLLLQKSSFCCHVSDRNALV